MRELGSCHVYPASWRGPVRTVSLGIGPVGAAMLRDLRRCLAVSDRREPVRPMGSCTLIARLRMRQHSSVAASSPVFVAAPLRDRHDDLCGASGRPDAAPR